MKKYALSLLVAMAAFLAPTAALYAQPDETPTVAAEEPSEPTTAPEDANTEPTAAPASPASDSGSEQPTSASSEPAEPTPAEQAAEDPLGTAGEIRTAVKSGNWGLAVLLSLMLLVSLLRWGAGKFDFLSFFEGKLGGYILVFTSSGGGMLLTVLTAGGSLTFATISEAIVFGFGAIGGWETIKDLRKKKKDEA